jgi:DNA-binding transcriptional LysR family regulator
MIGRRFLPAMPGLLALEAIDRLGTARAAAEELALTQGAVSRSLQALEAQMGVTLALRERQRLRLTPAAQDYARDVRASLAQLAEAGQRLRASPGGAGVRLAILPAFGVHWLVPRLAGFAAAHPEVTVTLATRMRPFDFASEPFDAAIHFGRADWPGAGHLHLLEEEVLPVCAPSLLPAPLPEPEALLGLPLLVLESRPGAWGRYLAAQGVTGQRPSGMVFDQFATLAEAATHGLGVGLLPRFLIERQLAEGRLVPAWPAPGRGLGSYYLVWPQGQPDRPALAAFRDWLRAEIAQ